MKISTTWKASDPNEPESKPREVIRFGADLSHYRIVECWSADDGARYRTLERRYTDAMGDESWWPVKRRARGDAMLMDALRAICVFADMAKEPAS